MSNNQDTLKVPISEIYLGIQGEGTQIGYPTIFVRVSGCNFAVDGHSCKYCDTPYAWNPSSATGELSSKELVQNLNQFVKSSMCHRICLTGGEPMMYLDSLREAITYLSNRYKLLIETNGSYDIYFSPNIVWSMDVKCPSSGNEDFNNFKSLSHLRDTDQVKFIIQDMSDFNYMKRVLSRYATSATIIIQPSWNKIELEELNKMILKDKTMRNVRLILQQHKVIHGNKRGV